MLQKWFSITCLCLFRSKIDSGIILRLVSASSQGFVAMHHTLKMRWIKKIIAKKIAIEYDHGSDNEIQKQENMEIAKYNIINHIII